MVFKASPQGTRTQTQVKNYPQPDLCPEPSRGWRGQRVGLGPWGAAPGWTLGGLGSGRAAGTWEISAYLRDSARSRKVPVLGLGALPRTACLFPDWPPGPFLALVCQPLQPHTHSLETLNLGHNPIGNEGVRNLKNGLIGNRSVLRLGLASTKLTCEGRVRGMAGPGWGAASGCGPVASPCGPPPRRGGSGGVHRREPPPPETGPSGERDQDGRAHGAVVGPQGEPLPAAPGPRP